MSPERSSFVSPSHGPLLPRFVNAVLLRRAFYDAVAADPLATGAAGAVVSLTAMARESVGVWEIAQVSAVWGLALVAVVLAACVGWLLYGTVAYVLARLLAPGPVEFKRVLRCLGYAETVTALRLAATLVDPSFYLPLHVALLAWTFAAVYVAMRSATQAPAVRLWAITVPAFVVQQAVLAAERLVAY